MKFSNLPSQDQQAAEQHKLLSLSCKYYREELVGTCGASGQRAPPGLTKARLCAGIKDKQMIPQEFKHAEIQLYNKRVMSWKMVYSFTSFRKKKLLRLLELWSSDWRFSLVEQQLMLFQSRNLRKAENKGLYIFFVK